MWTDMFEIASRGAAYGIVKQNFYIKNLAKNMSEKEAMEAAQVQAGAYTKNFANFEQVGEMGKALGAFYMFFRPAATGAVRAIEALAPDWPGSLERAVFNLPKSIKESEGAVEAIQHACIFKKILRYCVNIADVNFDNLWFRRAF